MSMFQKATRKAVKLKIGVQGPSGSGKTDGALMLGTALAEGGKIAVIDTENGSASLYADQYDFDTLNLSPPYTSARYIEAMEAAVEAGYSVLIIDSLSHQWAGEGGILARKEELDARGKGNSYTNWAKFTKEHEQFKARILALPIHVIATLRTKQDYVLVENDKGKQAPKKVGLAAVQREGFEYEFSVSFELQMDHRAEASKDRTRLFDGKLTNLKDPATGKALLEWLKSAEPADVVPQPAKAEPEAATPEQIKALADAAETGRQYLDHKALEWVEKVEITGCTAQQAEAALARFEAARKEWEAKQGAGEVPKAGRVSDALEESAEKKEDAKKPEPDDNGMTKEQEAALRTYSRAKWLPDAWRKKLALDLKNGMDRPTAAKWLTAIKEKSDALEKEAVAAEAAKDAEAA